MGHDPWRWSVHFLGGAQAIKDTNAVASAECGACAPPTLRCARARAWKNPRLPLNLSATAEATQSSPET
eukprot:363226-Chlamydomonas_euryale.AAC.6